MNTLFTNTTKTVSARFLAAVTAFAMILSAFPAAFFVAQAANTDAVGTVAVFVAASPAAGNSEYVSIKFTGTGTLNLEGWTISDEVGLRHTIGAGASLLSTETFVVCGDSSLPVVCDEEIDSGGNTVWNNAGDTMTLRDETNTVVHVVSWTSTTEGELQGVGQSSAIDYSQPTEPEPIYGCMEEGALNYDSTATEPGDVVCEYPEDEPEEPEDDRPVSQCLDENQNLLVNGSFEEPVVTANQKWNYLTATGWMTNALDDDASTDAELHRGWQNNQAAEGEQYAELDPRESVVMSQTPSVLEGGLYELSWAFAPRHNIDAAENQLSVLVDGSEVASEGPASLPAGLDASDWTRSSVTFTAESDSVEIGFADAGASSDSFGTFLDDARLCLVREPVVEEEPPEVCSLEGNLIEYTAEPKKNNGTPVSPARRTETSLDTVSATANFFGKESPYNDSDFFSLGIEGYLIYEFSDKIAVDQPGDDIAIWEVTGGNSGQSNEKAEVFFSEDGVNFVSVGVAQGDAAFDISGTGLDFVKFVKLEDQSTGVQGGNGDGFDVDAITIIEGSCEDFLTINTTKIVCEDEADLPNYGPNGPNMTANTATDWVAQENSCQIVDGWEFEWGPEDANDPGDSTIGAAGGDWTTFSGSVVLPAPAFDGMNHLWMREVLQEGYIPFTHEAEGKKNTDNYTAEFYCHTDVKNYDNYDRIDGPEAGGDYYCVGWNVPAEEPSQVYQCDAGLLYLDTESNDPEFMSLYTVDESDGSASFWSDYELNLFPVLAVASDEQVYSIDEDTGELVTLDDDSGAYTVIGDTGIKGQKPVAMEFAPDGTLYALTEKNDALYEINTANGVATKLHDLDLDVAGGDVVFEGDDIVYVRNAGQVYGIDDSSYIETLLGTLSVGSKRVTSAASKNGVHYAYTRQDSFHRFTLDPFAEGAAETGTGPFAWGDGSYCPADPDRPDAKLKVFKWVKNQHPEEVPFADFSYTIDGGEAMSFNNYGFDIEWLPTGETYEINEVDIPEGYEHFKTVCKVFDRPKHDIQSLNVRNNLVDEMPTEMELYKSVENWQEGPMNTVTLEDEDDIGICLIINKYDDDQPAPMCELEILSDSGTVVVENNAFAVPTYEHPNWSADITNAQWVWESYEVVDPESETVLTFEETFEVTNGQNALLEVAADNSYQAFLNGVLVIDQSAENNNFNTLTQDDEDVTVHLQDGTNTLRIVVTNNAVDGANYVQNPAGVLYRLTLEGDVESCDVTTDVTPVEPETYRIDGSKYQVTDNGTSTYAGWNIYAYNNDDATSLATTTDMNGYYYFDVEAGDWEITEEVLLDWNQVLVEQNDLPVQPNGENVAYCTFDEFGYEGEYQCDFYNEYDGEVIIPEPEEERSGGGGGGTRRTPRPTPLVLGEATSTVSQCPFLTDHMQMGWENDPMEVMKLQLFLNIFKDMFGGVEQPVTGTFGATTDFNVKAFQEQYRSEILDPWYNRGIVPHNRPTGFVYKTTLWKINDIICPEYAILPDFEGENLNENVDLHLNGIVD